MAPKALERLKRLGSPVLKGVGIALLYLLANLSPLSAANPRDVVINEVAWMGTAASSYDEWIELYNNTDEAIDLTGWKLIQKDGPEYAIPLFGVIPPRGFFLLERGDGSVNNIPADQVYNKASASLLRDEGEMLLLIAPDGTIVDTVNGDGGPWPAGVKATRSTMERIDPLAPDSDKNWCTNDGVHRNGHDANGDPINGTPKARNSCTNKPPIADAGPDQTVKVGHTVQLDGSGSSDPDGDPLSYSWSFISKPAGSGAALSNPSLVNPTFVADIVGDYILELVVRDDRGGTASDQVVITAVANQPPTAGFSYSPRAPTTCEEVQFTDASADQDGRLVAWAWAFGDGATSAERNPRHRYREPGAYTVTLTVWDDDSASDAASKELRVSLEEGDVDNDCERTVKDAVLAAKFALELLSPEEEQNEAADVVPPCGAIDVRDVVRIAEVALGIKGEEVFICEGGSGLGQGASLASAPRPAARLYLGSVVIPSGGRASIKLSTDVALEGLQLGPEGGLSFDPRVVQIRAVRGIPPYEVLASEIDNRAGRAKLMMLALGEPRGGEIIELEAEAVGREGESSIIKLIPDIAISPGGEVELEPAEARLTVGREGPLKVERILSFPNPVRGQGVRFAIEGQGIKELQVRVYDLSGREIFNSGWVAGMSFEWKLMSSRGQPVANGLYLYVVAVRGFGKDEMAQSGVRKLVVLR
jgi:PKD repeat protein